MEGADRLQLLDAVMQLLDYEYATGENLREMEYIPDDGSAAAAAETAAADLETAAANAAAAALAAETEAAALAAAAGEQVGEDAVEAEASFGYGGAAKDLEAGGADGEENMASPGFNADADDGGDEIAREVIGESSASPSASHSSCAVGDGDGGGESEVAELEFDESTVVGFAHSLITEVLRTMRRDMNYLVGMLPAPLAKPIRDTAAFVGHTASRFVAPALGQAERYTRGLRRGAGKAAAKGALALKEDILPRVAKGAKAAASKAKGRLAEALEARRKGKGVEAEGGEERQQQQRHGSPSD